MKKIKFIHNKVISDFPGGYSYHVKEYYDVIKIFNWLHENKIKINYIADANFAVNEKEELEKNTDIISFFQKYDIRKKAHKVDLIFNVDKEVEFESIIGKQEQNSNESLENARRVYVIKVHINILPFDKQLTEISDLDFYDKFVNNEGLKIGQIKRLEIFITNLKNKTPKTHEIRSNEFNEIAYLTQGQEDLQYYIWYKETDNDFYEIEFEDEDKGELEQYFTKEGKFKETKTLFENTLLNKINNTKDGNQEGI